MGRIENIKKLERIQVNINTIIEDINSLNDTKMFYEIFASELQRQHDLHIKSKCLEYWKRKFNKILKEIEYI